MTVVTRFAPSPTGNLHIGGARTALFNWLYAKKHNGKFLLRIEDTDKDRSKDEFALGIINQLHWLGLDWNDEVVYQSERIARHVEIAKQLVATGNAYYCYASKDELDQLRAEQEKAKVPFKYDRRWRDRPASDVPANVNPVIRLKMPIDGTTTIVDKVQGTVTIDNAQLDDMVLLRADGTPTYMLSVVVDDYDMGVTHVIRGDDHLNNAFRQLHIYKAMGWPEPIYAHIPLIHDESGKKLSKRADAAGLEDYQNNGYLPEAVRNYLVKMGWGHKNDEIISTDNMIEWFDVADIKKGPAQLNIDKLRNLNKHYLKEISTDRLLDIMIEKFQADNFLLYEDDLDVLDRGIREAVLRSTTINDLFENLKMYVVSPIGRLVTMDKPTVDKLIVKLSTIESDWTENSVKIALKTFALENDIKYPDFMQNLRFELTATKGGFLNLNYVVYAYGYLNVVKRLQNKGT